MADVKKIVCLANSQKPPSGRCVAGKEVLKNSYGVWIRPVSDRLTEEISIDEMTFENGEIPQLLDIIEIPTKRHVPNRIQPENYLIDAKYYWKKVGTLSKRDLPSLVDSVKGELWENGHHTNYGLNDRVPEESVLSNKRSLLFIQPEKLVVSVALEYPGQSYQKRRVRALFKLNDLSYKLSITDVDIRQEFLSKRDGDYELNHRKVYMCISLAPYDDEYCYKLCASLIMV